MIEVKNDHGEKIKIFFFIIAPCMLLRLFLLFQLTHTFIHF